MKTMTDRPLKVCFFGTYRANYIRHQVLLARLASAGVDVIECHQRLWLGDQDRIDAASGRWLHPGFIWRVLLAYIRLTFQYLTIEDHDIVIVGYPGQFDVLPARILSWLRRKHMVWDILMSIYLIAKERNLDQESALTVKSLKLVEWVACRLPDALFLDTRAYIDWFSKTYHIPTSRFQLTPLGADENLFRPKSKAKQSVDKFTVIYYGTFNPNSGIIYIIEAAHLLKNQVNIHFELIGGGPQWELIKENINNYNLTNITTIEWLEIDKLVKRAQQAQIILGTFGTTPQALLTVQNKIYQGLAMSKAVLTGASPAVDEIFKHEKHLYLTDRANPQAIAYGIKTLYDKPLMRHSLAESGYNLFLEHFTTAKLGAQLKEQLLEIV
jgi:glycosyltransferase involved in cell wall biosynthesis